MRLAYTVLTLIILGAAGRAAATSCSPPPWDYQIPEPLGIYGEGTPVPVDAHPWTTQSCYGGVPALPTGCQFLDQDDQADVIDATVEASDGSACNVEYYNLPGDTSANIIYTFVPAQPLVPSHIYRVECDDPSNYGSVWGEVRVRDDAKPAAAPAALEVVDATYSRDSNGCCGHGDDIQIEITNAGEGYLAEGGYIDIGLSTGQRFVAGLDDVIVVPPAEGIITLTPVSASGVRGKTVKVDADEIGGDLVYIPCSIAAGSSPAALWLLAPFAWIFAHGRRRRGVV